ncbi:MAG: HDOD domain-containing protein [Myxococcales bacterium]|nr:HDOD domain-containing protein [Myxococcales bacterium]MCB9671826.1 HDOD domain-containing protein [Alphaproteobacteria bacterium]
MSAVELNVDPLSAFLHDDVALGSLPGAYVRLSKVLQDPASTPKEMAAAVSMDPGLVARLLKLVNAPGFARRPIETVSHACLYLGRDQLRDLALATTVVQMFRGLPEHLLSMRSFWTHSVAVGLLSEALGQRAGIGSENLFVAGLLHDVGTLAMCIGKPMEMRRVLMDAEAGQVMMEDAELDRLGFTHPECGEVLLTRWGLPRFHVAVARHHHDSALAAVWRGHRQAVAMVHVADAIAIGLHWGSAGERRAHDISDEAYAATGLSLEDLDNAVDLVEDRLDEVVSALI